ncbi:MAG: ATP-binding protein [Caldilineaceae bacterium]
MPHIFGAVLPGGEARAVAGGGAGLGLAIAKGLVEAHGEIRIRSVVGRGTSVAFSLPRTHDVCDGTCNRWSAHAHMRTGRSANLHPKSSTHGT